MTDPLATGNGTPTQVDVAMQALRHAIVRGEVAPGERVKEQELAQRLEMSRTPVREAVRRLVGEGVLVHVTNHGATVPKWTAHDVEEIFEVRALLEGYAAGLAAERATPRSVEHLREMCDDMRALEASRGALRWDEYAVLNDLFHRELFQVAENQRLGTLLGSLLGVPLLHRNFAGHTAEAMARSNRHHEEIVDAVETGDGSWARTAMQAHVHATRQLLLHAWDSRDDLDT